MSEPLTAEDRLRDAIAGERRDWHRVEVSSHDIEVVLATLDAARDRPGLDVAWERVATDHGCLDPKEHLVRAHKDAAQQREGAGE